VALRPRSRDRPTAFRLRVTTAERRSHVVLGLARSCAVILGDDAVRDTSHPFDRRGAKKRDDCSPLAQTPRRLGPRSLVPPLFSERCVRAYSRPGCCSSTSATAYDVRALSPGLSIPRRDDGHDHLPFLDASRTTSAVACEAVTRGEPRIRPKARAPVPVPPACAGLPDRDTSTPRHPV